MPIAGPLGSVLSSTGTEWVARTRIRSGTWTPKLRTTGMIATGETYAIREGFWVRFDADDPALPAAWAVMISGRMKLTSKGTIDGNALAIGGLPFPVAPSDNAFFGAIQVSWWQGMTIALTWLGGYFWPSTDAMIITMTTASAAGNGHPGGNQVGDAFDMAFSGVYFTDQV